MTDEKQNQIQGQDPHEPSGQRGQNPTQPYAAGSPGPTSYDAHLEAAGSISGEAAGGEAGRRTPFKERVLGARAVVAVALASVLLGGAGGAALGALSAGSDDDGGFGGPGGGRPGNFGQPPAQPDGGTQPDSSSQNS